MVDLHPRLNQVNVITTDMQAAVRFYRLLGIDIADSIHEWPPDSGAQHAAVAFDHGTTIEFDNRSMLGLYAADAANVRGSIIGLSFESAEEVDAAFERARAAGYMTRQPPYDAFWGARYAIIEDPDGNAVGLMGPIDRARSYMPRVI